MSIHYSSPGRNTVGNTLTVRNPDGTEFKRIEVTSDYYHKRYAIWAPESGEIIRDMVISVLFNEEIQY